MACYHPIPAWRTEEGGKLAFSVKAALARGGIFRELEIPCGQCVGCRLERSRQWAMRCMHEAELHVENSFITLTYAPEHLPGDLSLDYKDYQHFMKRLRKRVAKPVRFYMCGEYGEQFGRPHFHACLFGYDFPDKVFLKKTGSGSKLYTSALLEDLWPFGHSSVGDVNFESAAYVARYVMKKVTGDAAEEHYRWVDSDGVVHERRPEFNKMSLKPGIGAGWFDRFSGDVYPHDEVIVRGRSVKPPKFYDRRLEKTDPFMLEEVQFRRQQDALKTVGDTTPERLAVRERVVRANLERFARKLD